MPVAKIHALEGQYDEARLAKVSSAVQMAHKHAGYSAGRLLPNLSRFCPGTNFFTRRRSWASTIRMI